MRKEVIAQRDPKSPISEVFRTLRTNIQFMNTSGKLKTLLVTSTLSGEGKSWTSANLAVTFAQAGKKVILVDADMRKGRQYTIFGVSPRPGLSNYLSEIGSGDNIDLADYIQETEVENLYLISAGNVPPNPSELLVTPQMVNLLDQLKELSDIVILDGTPSQLVTDSLILTRLVDSTIIVTASKETKKENLKRVINNINNVGGKISGIVVNKLPISAKKYEQSYYYGSTGFNNDKTSMKSRELYNRTSAAMNATNNRQNIKSQELYNRTSAAMNTNNNKSRKKINEKELKNVKTLQKNIKVEHREEVSLERTTDILNQINQYLDEEKKKLK